MFAPTKKKQRGRKEKKAGFHDPASGLEKEKRAVRERKAQKAAGIQWLIFCFIGLFRIPLIGFPASVLLPRAKLGKSIGKRAGTDWMR